MDNRFYQQYQHFPLLTQSLPDYRQNGRKRRILAGIQRAEKKTRKRENPPRRRCWDWMIVGGHCHFARNRSSFKTYRRLRGEAGTPNAARVIGIGTVELLVRRSWNDPKPYKLVLEDVLHIPDAICNGFNPMLLSDGACCQCRSGKDGWQGIDPYTEEQLWYTKPFARLSKLVLAGNPQGE
ncbi:hypothetical protein VTN77DRAFT_4786 [Rasamsonia byssochlamydoides]|uniref:uncharacterized protein n=1 Tax=Rasamsonia byssochlamydoides TaxID=89139 RepID=UPI0037432BD3